MKLSFEQKESGRHIRIMTAQKVFKVCLLKLVFFASALMETESKRMFQKDFRDHFHICINFTAQEFNRRDGTKTSGTAALNLSLLGTATIKDEFHT
jgi:hypothetical protein